MCVHAFISLSSLFPWSGMYVDIRTCVVHNRKLSVVMLFKLPTLWKLCACASSWIRMTWGLKHVLLYILFLKKNSCWPIIKKTLQSKSYVDGTSERKLEAAKDLPRWRADQLSETVATHPTASLLLAPCTCLKKCLELNRACDERQITKLQYIIKISHVKTIGNKIGTCNGSMHEVALSAA